MSLNVMGRIVICFLLDSAEYPNQEAVAEAMGVSEGTVNGDLKNFKSEILEQPDDLQLTNVWRFAQCDRVLPNKREPRVW